MVEHIILDQDIRNTSGLIPEDLDGDVLLPERMATGQFIVGKVDKVPQSSLFVTADASIHYISDQ